MVADWVVPLAASGAGALLSAAATDAWQSARSGILRLFARAGERRQEAAVALFDDDARRVEQAAQADRNGVRDDLLPIWQTRLADLLREFAGDAGPQSDLAAEVAAVTRAMQAQLPRQSWVQHNTAREGGTVFAVQHGNQHVHHPDDQSGRDDQR